MDHLRIDPDIDTDPGIEQAGWCAARVYELLLKVSAKYDLHGRIPAERQNSTWLARRWNLTPSDLPGVNPEDFIANGIARLLQSGMLREDGDAWLIRGWEKFYAPKRTSTDRVKDYRARHRGQGETHETPETVSSVSPRFGNDETPETLHHTTPPTPLHPTPQPTPARERAVGGLKDGLDAVFLKAKGAPFQWTTRDEEAIRPLLAHPEAEVLRRWEIGLGMRYPACNSLRDLATNWNAYAAAPPATGAGPPRNTLRRGVARAEDADHSKNRVVDEHGTIDF